MEQLLQILAQVGGMAGAVAAIFIYQNLRSTKRLEDRLDALQDKHVEMIQNETKAKQELASALKGFTKSLGARPCMAGQVAESETP